MGTLKRESYEWALMHLLKFYDSDFYPTLFEFKSIKHDWDKVLAHLMALDIDSYAPSAPFITVAPKPNGTYRVVHQLDPIDSIIYAALAYENAKLIEAERVPKERRIACSYRLNPDTNGSFFDSDNQGFQHFLDRAEELAKAFTGGYVLMTDLVDFYNQIYLHRVSNLLEEAGSANNSSFEKFLLGLNSNVSKGIPVGPVPSIIVSEAILSDIDNKILRHTADYTRYVDDINIFFNTKEDAQRVLHDLTLYLHSNHRLVLSSDKTRIISTRDFLEKYLQNEERTEKQKLHSKINQIEEYPEPEAQPEFDKLDGKQKFRIRVEAYSELFEQALAFDKIDLGLMRHILRRAGQYRIKSIIPSIFSHFDRLLPVLREVVIYFTRVLSDYTAQKYEKEFNEVLQKPYLDNIFINIWVFTLFQHLAFNATSIKIDYKKVYRIRERALIARRSNDKTWVKEMKDSIDALGPWDKRAVIHSAIVLSKDEAVHWLGLVSSKGDLLEKAICSKTIKDKKGE